MCDNSEDLTFHIISPQAILSRAKKYLETLKMFEKTFAFFICFTKKYQKSLVKLNESFGKAFMSLNCSISNSATFNQKYNETLMKNHVELKTKYKSYQEYLNQQENKFNSEIKCLKKSFEKEISIKFLTKEIEKFCKKYDSYRDRLRGVCKKKNSCGASDTTNSTNSSSNSSSCLNENFYTYFLKFYEYYSNICLKLNEFEIKKLSMYFNLVNTMNFQNPSILDQCSVDTKSKNLVENWLNLNQIVIKIDKNFTKYFDKFNQESTLCKKNEMKKNIENEESCCQSYDDDSISSDLKCRNIESINIENAYSMDKIMKNFEKYIY